MWIKKKEWDELKEKVAALETEQLQLKKYAANNIKHDEQMVETIRLYRDDIKKLLETQNAYVAE